MGRSNERDERPTIGLVADKDLDELGMTPFIFAGSEIRVASAPFGKRINVLHELRDPSGFLEAGGNPNVHALVDFGQAFAPLIGTYAGDFWGDKDKLAGMGVMILADHYDNAAQLVGKIDSHARRLVADPRLYDDLEFCREYYELAKAGYGLIDTLSPYADRGRPLSLVRAGLVTTRLAQGVAQETEIANEVRVVTKRQHPKKGEDTDLMVTVEWEDINQAHELQGENIEIADFVNPASGASTAAVVVAARKHGVVPSKIIHRSIAATRAGIPFIRRAFGKMGIATTFYTLGTSGSMNENYYLDGGFVVGDAGHALRHFQPTQYRR